MKASARIIEYIKQKEGLSLVLYNDCDNPPNATIGYGYLVHLGPINGSEPEEFRKGITEKQAFGLLLMEIGEIEKDVMRLVKVPLTQYQFDALVSFTFNLGEGSLERSTLLKCLNAKQYGQIPYEIRKWVRAGGRVVPGLVTRRKEEADIFLGGKYEAIG